MQEKADPLLWYITFNTVLVSCIFSHSLAKCDCISSISFSCWRKKHRKIHSLWSKISSISVTLCYGYHKRGNRFFLFSKWNRNRSKFDGRKFMCGNFNEMPSSAHKTVLWKMIVTLLSLNSRSLHAMLTRRHDQCTAITNRNQWSDKSLQIDQSAM